MLMIHVGVMPDEVDSFVAQMARHGEKHDVYLTPITENDSWETWGEPIGRETEPDGTLMSYSGAVHVTMSTMKPMEHLHFVANHFASFLIPMSRNYEGMRMCLTDATDSSEEYEEYRW